MPKSEYVLEENNVVYVDKSLYLNDLIDWANGLGLENDDDFMVFTK